MEKKHPATACSEDEFAALVESELDALPGWIKSAIATHNVAISIEDERPNQPRTLGVFARYSGASEITLYRLPINRVALDRQHLQRAGLDAGIPARVEAGGRLRLWRGLPTPSSGCSRGSRETRANVATAPVRES